MNVVRSEREAPGWRLLVTLQTDGPVTAGQVVAFGVLEAAADRFAGGVPVDPAGRLGL